MPVAREFLLYYLRKDVDELPGDFVLSLDGKACRSWHRAFLKGCHGGTINLERREITHFAALRRATRDIVFGWWCLPSLIDSLVYANLYL